MITLQTLLHNIVAVDQAINVSGLALDSRLVQSGQVFIALAGSVQHGLAHVEQALSNGACAVLFDPAAGGLQLAAQINTVPTIAIAHLNVHLGAIAARFYHHPSHAMTVIGITGTNGKTSCSQFLGQLLDDCGIIGTLGWGEWGNLNKTLNTTPDALAVQRILATLLTQKKRTVAMEVSSHGLDQGRVNGVQFTGAIFTNISRDHLDYHGTMEAYVQAKLTLLQAPNLAFVVVNLDDAYSEQIIAATPESVVIWGISVNGNTPRSGKNLIADNIVHQANGIDFTVHFDKTPPQRISIPLYGDFNIENVLCVLAVLLATGTSLATAAAKLKMLRPIAGRMERFGGTEQPLVVVDYAHTPDALHKVLASLKKHTQGRLGVVFGCGGERDKGKRSLMGQIAVQWADQVIVTDDNPRSEDNLAIINDIIAGCRLDNLAVIPDRAQAIDHAIATATALDCILIAGKGHEDYQDINGIKYPFSDKNCVLKSLIKQETKNKMTMMLSEIAACVQGELVGADVAITSICIDTRTLKPQQLYVAIKGENFDGNDFIDQAERSGAVAAIVHQGVKTPLPHIVVADSRLALGKLASAWRNKAQAKIVGVTGSNGKTTVKEMLAAILGVNDNVLFTQGNFNNDIGVPLTLLRLNKQHRYAVIEMGANHLHEIAYTSTITQADVVVLNNAGAAHLEGFGSLDGVAKAKGEIIATLKDSGVAILNRDDRYFNDWKTLAGNRKTLSFGFNADADITAKAVKMERLDNVFVTTFTLITPEQSIDITLKLAGHHNVLNALAATAATLALGLSLDHIKQGLATVKPVTGRLQPLVSRWGAIVIDDTYNANASSLKVGLDVLTACAGQPWLVLGAFGELGANSPQLHSEIGELIKASGVTRLFAVGDLSQYAVQAFGAGGSFFATQAELITALSAELTGNETLLIKGSRNQRMENVVAALVDNFRI